MTPKKVRLAYQLHTDGGIDAEQGQPEGEAAIGVVLLAPDGSEVHRISARIGWAKDHHVAEYRALIAGLRLARGHGVEHLRAYLDSKLVVSQVNGVWKLKAEHLRPLWREARRLASRFQDFEISWVPRKQNADADALASRALGR